MKAANQSIGCSSCLKNIGYQKYPYFLMQLKLIHRFFLQWVFKMHRYLFFIFLFYPHLKSHSEVRHLFEEMLNWALPHQILKKNRQNTLYKETKQFMSIYIPKPYSLKYSSDKSKSSNCWSTRSHTCLHALALNATERQQSREQTPLAILCMPYEEIKWPGLLIFFCSAFCLF